MLGYVIIFSNQIISLSYAFKVWLNIQNITFSAGHLQK
jgi:hypothetical protein